MEKIRKCGKCKKEKPLNEFRILRNGNYGKRCLICVKAQMCEHNKIRSFCKECGGSQICEHGKIKSRCKKCGGSQICEHGKRKGICKECGGSQICEHNKIRSCCKECGGSQICEHKKIRTFCKECGGGSICEHNKIRSRCKKCGGGSICEHTKIRSFCKECGGGSICEHNKIRSRCKECGGGSICEHGKIKSYCKECGGSQICEHKKRRTLCIECGGASICSHNKIRRYCRICDPPLHPHLWCKLCKYTNIGYQPKYKPYCFNCYCITFPDVEIERRFKLKEHHMRNALKAKYENVRLVFDKKVECGCSKRRPDCRIELYKYSIIIECDENKHKNYSCENKRMMELFGDLGSRPIIFLRFNPDSYTDKDGKNIKGCFSKTAEIDNSLQIKEWTNRISILKERIDYHLENEPNKEVTIEYLFYGDDLGDDNILSELQNLNISDIK